MFKIFGTKNRLPSTEHCDLDLDCIHCLRFDLHRGNTITPPPPLSTPIVADICSGCLTSLPVASLSDFSSWRPSPVASPTSSAPVADVVTAGTSKVPLSLSSDVHTVQIYSLYCCFYLCLLVKHNTMSSRH